MPTRLPAAGTPQLPERGPRGASPCAVDRAGLGPLAEEGEAAGRVSAADAASEAAKAWLERLRGPSCAAEEGSPVHSGATPAQAEDPFDPPKKPTDMHRREGCASDVSHMHSLSLKEASPQFPQRDPARSQLVGSPQLPMRGPAQEGGSSSLARVASPHLPARYPGTPQAQCRFPSEQIPAEQKDQIRQVLRSVGLTEPEGEQLDPVGVMKENEYLKRNRENLVLVKHQLESKLKDMQVRNMSLEQQNQVLNSAARGDAGGVEITSLQQQLGAAMQIKDALHIQNVELQQRLETAQQSTEDADQKKTCVVCMDNLPNVVCLPCKHLGLCSICSQACSLKQCPICRSEIIDKMQVYLV